MPSHFATLQFPIRKLPPADTADKVRQRAIRLIPERKWTNQEHTDEVSPMFDALESLCASSAGRQAVRGGKKF